MDEISKKQLLLNNLNSEEAELYELSFLSGISWNPKVFK